MLRHLLHAASAAVTMLVYGASLSLERLDDHLDFEDGDLTPPRHYHPAYALEGSAAELDALYLASALYHGIPVSEVGVPVAFGTGSTEEATATERMTVAMLHDWGHFDE